MSNEDQSSLDSIWESEDPVFADKELLDIEHIPDEERIIGREDEISNLANSIHPAIRGGKPRNTLIYGKTGTGKSLVAKHVTQSAENFAHEQGTRLDRAYIDCTQATTETQVVIKLARTFNRSDETDISVPLSGLSTNAYYDRLWQVLDTLHDVVIIILDEVDKLQENNVLMQLSRAGEAGKIDSCKVGILAISNKISFKDSLDERVLSSLQEREFIFPPYDANQLREIMRHRQDAFREGALTDDVIPLAAAFAAQEHGDARKALDILRNAGELAKDDDSDVVREEHVRNAREKADIDRFSKLLQDQPTQSKAAVYALSLIADGSKQEEFPTREIYERYERLSESLDIDPLSQRRMSDRLNEQVFLDILGVTDRVGRGRGKGMTNFYYLLEEPEVVQSAIESDQRFSIDG
ncbi:orc1/cdc6 family replication initiation protein [Halobacterium salinarum]|uniref:ORC1-type DNA replication protein n=2 Tax=Halobacterium salinarum TaxID=2242 RepID=A0A4D6GS64_HALS9|nr:orc1/cdc6 family replication initiation protein [Halobacterium salinarum]MDL0136091.1 orc1/cdc6 family replication initiation protein [Halobacterium salinarum]MDL0140476.1 orc1/cdc6 family replication initiation protein [Halobacterium salinarum]QCC44575.1 Orc1-type DNA replication protein [Halobacterium salinarum]TYO71791.1 cell division control protein 6 [Halobacterium salinarum DSM 3754]